MRRLTTTLAALVMLAELAARHSQQREVVRRAVPPPKAAPILQAALPELLAIQILAFPTPQPIRRPVPDAGRRPTR